MTDLHVTTAAPRDLRWRYTIPPRTDSKMLLLNLGGVAVIGNWSGEVGQYFLGWCPLPKRDKDAERAAGLRA